MKFERYRDASNRLNIGISGYPAWKYRIDAWKIKKKFNLKKHGPLVNGLDEIFQEFSKGNMVVSIEWDIWSDFSITAINQESESLVEEIGQYMKLKYCKEKT